jgi:hypothetical protein
MSEGDYSGPGDGRNIDPSTGILEGEGSEQKVPEPRAQTEGTAPFDVWTGVPSEPGLRERATTYYDRPVLKEPVWIWAVPAYFYAGGVAGSAAVLAATAQAFGGRGMRGLVRKSRWIAAIGGAAGTALLIYDLGRPERFLNMLRVFRASSPLSVGSWVLATAGPLTAGSAMLAGSDGVLRVAGDAAGYAAGLVGLPLSGYTAVLLSNTAVPVWQEIRRSLPVLFVSSALAGAATILELLPLEEPERRVVHRLGIMGKIAELAAIQGVDREASRVAQVGRALREGLPGSVLRAAKASTAASLGLSLLPGKGRWKRTIAALLGTAGAVGYKFGIFYAGQASARDPRATFNLQRASGG